MKKFRWHILIGLSLIAAAALLYGCQLALYHDPRNTFFYLLQDLAFLPVQILVVTLVINEVLRLREKNNLQCKMNMVIGSFFSEMGGELLARLTQFDTGFAALQPHLPGGTAWSDSGFTAARRAVVAHQYAMDSHRGNLPALRALLQEKRTCLLNLLANPNLLEHDTFTDLLWTISHLAEELALRTDLQALPETDHQHLAGDMQRAYVLLLAEWLAYVQHLHDAYPYMYSLVLRAGPLAACPTPVLQPGKPRRASESSE